MSVRDELEPSRVLYKPSHAMHVATSRAVEYLPAFIAFLALLGLWEIGTAHLHLIAAYLLPAPSAIAEELGEHWLYLLQQTWVTVQEILLGYLAGMLLGFGLALLIFYSRILQRTLYPFVLMTQYVPKLAVAPLIIVWFGLDIRPKVLVTALICMFPIMINSLLGLRSSDAQTLELMYLLNATRWQTFWMIRLQAAAPLAFVGLKVGITLATTGAIVAEWISADAGLGYLIVFSLGDFQITTLYASLIMLMGLGLALFGLVVLAERLLMPHQPRSGIAERLL